MFTKQFCVQQALDCGSSYDTSLIRLRSKSQPLASALQQCINTVVCPLLNIPTGDPRRLYNFQHGILQTCTDALNECIQDNDQLWGVKYGRPRPVQVADLEFLQMCLSTYMYNGSTQCNNGNSWFMGTTRQYLSGRLIAATMDFYAKDLVQHSPLKSVHPLVGVLLNPTAGLIGKGNTTYPENATSLCAINRSELALLLHVAAHDAVGFVKDAFQVGPGYEYRSDASAPIQKSWLLAHTEGLHKYTSYMLEGYLFWKHLTSNCF